MIKKIIIFAFFILILVFVFWWANGKDFGKYQDFFDKEVVVDVPIEQKEFKPNELILNSKIIAPNTNTEIAFEKGVSNFIIDSFENYASISSDFFLIEHNETRNYFTELTINSGGTGNFKYLVHFLEKENNLVYTSSQFIGDRVPVLSVEKSNPFKSEIVSDLNSEGFFVKVVYLDRNLEDSFSSEPTLKTEKIFRVENRLLPSKKDIFVTNISANEQVSSPLVINGFARGVWFFEGSFPVYLADWDGKIIAEGVAESSNEWMTENFIPYTVKLDFQKPSYGINGTLVLKKDNPSGMPEFDDALEFNVQFK